MKIYKALFFFNINNYGFGTGLIKSQNAYYSMNYFLNLKIKLFLKKFKFHHHFN